MNISIFRRSLFVMLGTAFALVMSVLLTQSIFAASFTWSGVTDTDLATDTNWVGDTAPADGDTMVFDVSTYDFDSNPLTNDFAADTDFEIQVTGADTDGVYISGAAMDLRDDAGADGVAVSTTGGGWLTLDLDATLIGEVEADTIGDIYFDGALVLAGASSFTPTSGYITCTSLGTVDLVTFALTINDGDFVFFDGVISGTTGSIVTDNTSGIELSGANDFAGVVTVNAGAIVQLNHESALGTAVGATTVADGAQLILAFLDTTDAVVSENITFGGGLGVAGNQAAFYVRHTLDVPDPIIADAPVKGDLTFDGTLTLSADSTFYAEPYFYSNSTFTLNTLDGATFTLTEVDGSGGTLKKLAGDSEAIVAGSPYDHGGAITDDQSATPFTVWPNSILTVNTGGTVGDVIILSGGVLTGVGGTSGDTSFMGGTFDPGASPGCFSTGDLDMDAGSSLDVELQSTTACTGYDQIQVTGTVDVTGATLNVVYLAGYVADEGDEFTIISNDLADAVTGTFAGLAEGATFTVDSTTFAISYVGGDGNDVVLTAQAAAVVPPEEPDTGFGPITINYLTVFALTILASGTLFTLAYIEDRKK